MRQIFLNLALLILSVNLFVSCKKDKDLGSNDNVAIAKSSNNFIAEWLVSQKAGSSIQRVVQIENIIKNLDLDKTWNEPLTKDKYITIVPIKNNYLDEKKLDEQPTLYLVTVINKEKGIQNMFIAQNTFRNGGRSNIGAGEISKILKQKTTPLKNNFSFYNIYQSDFNNSNRDLEVASNFSNKTFDSANTSGSVSNTQSKCTDWYWVTTYSDGSQTWQYVFSTCDSDGMSFEPDGGGGGSPSTGNLANEFNSYVLSTSTPAYINCSPSNDGPDPISGIISWTVVKGLISGWNISANTQYSYYHYIYSTPSFFEHQYNITNYQTISSSFHGSNSLITSTWSQTGVNDQINNNNSANAYGHSQVVGTIKHRSNFTIPSPVSGGSSTTLEMVEPVNGSADIYPH